MINIEAIGGENLQIDIVLYDVLTTPNTSFKENVAAL